MDNLSQDAGNGNSAADQPPTDNPLADNSNGNDGGALNRPLQITKFPNLHAKTMEVLVLTAHELARHMVSIQSPPMDGSLEAMKAAKARLPLFNGGRFGDKRTAAGSLRSNDNVKSMDCIFVEHDAGWLPMDHAAAMLGGGNLAAFLYTTTSHTQVHPRYRIVLPLSKPCPPEDHSKFVARANGALKGALAPESFTLSQAYYGGVVVRENYETAFVEGRFTDEADDLDAGAIGKNGAGPKRDDTGKGDHAADGAAHDRGERVFDGDMNRLARVLVDISASASATYYPWLDIIMAIHHESGGSATGLAIAHDWSRGSPNYDPKELDYKWKTLGKK